MKTGRVIQMSQHGTVLLHALSQREPANCWSRDEGSRVSVENSELACRVTTEKSKNMMGRAWVRSRLRICGIYGGQRGTGTSFSPSVWIFPVTVIPPMLRAYSLICHRRYIISAVDSVVKLNLTCSAVMLANGRDHATDPVASPNGQTSNCTYAR